MTRSESQSYWNRIYLLSQTNPSREDELPNEQEVLGEVGGTAEPLEDKPGEDVDELAKETEVMAGGGKKGKKKNKKKDEW